MTAEIAIMNKEAIALAADSAATMPGKKIFTSANKLFALSKYHPVGIMVYGNAIFMGVPWETIVKVYRKNLSKKRFDTLKEYANDFISFLDNGNPLFPDAEQEAFLKWTIYSYFEFIKRQIKGEIKSRMNDKGEISVEEMKQIVSKVVKEHYEEWEKTDNIPSITKSYNEEVLNKHKDSIIKAIEEVFEKLPISENETNQLKRIAASLFSKFPENLKKEDISGVVIAGFGEKDTFPSLKSFYLEGIVNNKLKYEELKFREISISTSSWVIPFAQTEMVETFMEGVDPDYRRVEESYLTKIFDEYAGIVVDTLKGCTKEEKTTLKEKLVKAGREILDDLGKKLESHRKEKYASPVTTIASMLPKDELAVMAETLVNLTSFKRKVTPESETVGGPVDVAVISKGDGFVWIKRKHYFKPELNAQFFANYYMESKNE